MAIDFNFINATDEILLPLGFKRPKSDQQWKRKKDAAHTEWIHLGFGLGSVIATVGITFTDLKKFNPPGGVWHIGQNIDGLLDPKPTYTLGGSPELMTKHLIDLGMPWLENMSNEDAVISALSQTEPKNWVVPSYSHKIRLLPLLLAKNKRKDEAWQMVEKFVVDCDLKDQMLPKYPEFVAWFKSTFAV